LISEPCAGVSTMSLLASERNLPERLKSLRITSATSVDSGAPPCWANGTTTIGVAVLTPPMMSTVSGDWATTGPANSAAAATMSRAMPRLNFRVGLVIAA